MKIKVKTDISLSEDSVKAMQDWAYGSSLFDLDGGFRSKGEGAHKAKTLHLVTSLPGGIEARPTEAKYVAGQNLPETTYILIEDSTGRMHDYHDCKQLVETNHVVAVVFSDAQGTLWAACKEPGSNEDTSYKDCPLVQVSRHTHPTVEEGFGKIHNNLPAEGEFQLTEEKPARVAWIPWWTSFGSSPDVEKKFPEEDEVLELLKNRALFMRAKGEVALDPSPEERAAQGVIQMPLRLQDWQTEDGSALQEGVPTAIDLNLEMRDTRYDFTAQDGQKISIELQNGRLRVLAYNDTSDGPVTVMIPKNGDIMTDTDAFYSEKHPDDSMEP